MLPEETAGPITLLPDNTVLPHQRLLGLFKNRRQWEDRLVGTVTQNPLESLIAFLVSSSAAFYLVESKVNPKIRTFWDSLYYITTCASVGYADMFAQTQAGRMIASVVFTFGPALCAQVFDRDPSESKSPSHEREVERLLAAIHAQLQKSGTA